MWKKNLPCRRLLPNFGGKKFYLVTKMKFFIFKFLRAYLNGRRGAARNICLAFGAPGAFFIEKDTTLANLLRKVSYQDPRTHFDVIAYERSCSIGE